MTDRERIDLLLALRLTGDLEPADERELERRLAESPELRVEMAELEAAFAELERAGAEPGEDSPGAFYDERLAPALAARTRTARARRLLRAAAVVIAFVCGMAVQRAMTPVASEPPVHEVVADERPTGSDPVREPHIVEEAWREAQSGSSGFSRSLVALARLKRS